MEKKKKVYMAYLDLEKAYDRVPREVVYWCLQKKRSARTNDKDDAGNIQRGNN